LGLHAAGKQFEQGAMFLPDLVLAGEAIEAATAMLSASGFQVFDLGVDVFFDDFALKAKELHADIVGLSALLTTTMTGQKGVVEALQRHGLRLLRARRRRERALLDEAGSSEGGRVSRFAEKLLLFVVSELPLRRQMLGHIWGFRP
jgi:cobalamin-dependent methionine synthase I